MSIIIDGIDISEDDISRGRVRFWLALFKNQDALKLEVPFQNAESLDAALRAGLYVLKLVGEQLAQDAQQTALSIGHDLRDVHPDGS